MGQFWQIFNLTKGVVMPINDGQKYMEKGLSIYALVLLLQDDWQGDKIVMLGDYDEDSQQYTDQFLSVYKMKYEGSKNLFDLWYRGYLPQKAYNRCITTKFQQKYLDPIPRYHVEDEDPFDYFIISQKNTMFGYTTKKEKIIRTETVEIYAFVNHTKQEYVKFDEAFFRGFHTCSFYDDEDGDKDYALMKMTLPILNPLVKNVVQGLIAHAGEQNADCQRGWSGKFAGDCLAFMKESTLPAGYRNILEDLVKKDYIFATHEDLATINGKAGWIMYEDIFYYPDLERHQLLRSKRGSENV